ncbi:MAG: hypothetical protein HC819_17265 [Cyclobacteriaceae bacterium]|nr:hypothetical protein [Cyclobacteriaceae bacterium]
MKDILKNLFWKDARKVPDQVKCAFLKTFPEAFNEEWSLEGANWEAVFYLDQVEKIARFSKDGTVQELRTNMAIGELPPHIEAAIAPYGEIMSAISIEKENVLSWEIIYRNEQLSRFVCYLDETGAELSKKKL